VNWDKRRAYKRFRRLNDAMYKSRIELLRWQDGHKGPREGLTGVRTWLRLQKIAWGCERKFYRGQMELASTGRVSHDHSRVVRRYNHKRDAWWDEEEG
jgi:hypothetical protein